MSFAALNSTQGGAPLSASVPIRGAGESGVTYAKSVARAAPRYVFMDFSFMTEKIRGVAEGCTIDDAMRGAEMTGAWHHKVRKGSFEPISLGARATHVADPLLAAYSGAGSANPIAAGVQRGVSPTRTQVKINEEATYKSDAETQQAAAIARGAIDPTSRRPIPPGFNIGMRSSTGGSQGRAVAHNSLPGISIVRLVYELDVDRCPNAAENFRRLCTGERGVDSRTGATLHYKGTYMHKLIPGFIVAGGDVATSEGTDNFVSAVGHGRWFDDEGLQTPHTEPGLLSCVNNGPNSNGTQFFLTLCHDGQKKLDTRHCCFGRVVRGMTAFQRAIKRCYISGTNVLSSTVVIADCGEVEEMPPLVPSDEE